MQIDDLKKAWASHGAELERRSAINERLLRGVLLRDVRFALVPYVLWRAIEVVIGIAVLFAVMSVLGAHAGEPRYAIVAGMVAIFTVAITALTFYLLVKGLRLDYDGPVLTIQRDVERIKLMEYHAFKWALLGGAMLWLPVLLVLFEALTRVDALARANLPWVVGNILFGLIVLGIGQLLSRKYVERPDLGARARWLIAALSGRSLRSANRHLAELARFENEELPVLQGPSGLPK